LLYIWFRLHALNMDLPEKVFQRLERHWSLVMTEVGAEVRRLAAGR